MADGCISPPDGDQRLRALDVTRSFIVQAPAGSGKTELLTQRILALLGTAGQPEEILAVTFTRKAAAEMHRRLLEALEKAGEEKPLGGHELHTWELARKALERDAQRGWQLLGNPGRLQVMTIDSLCSMLARRMPWLASFGEAPAVAAEPSELYREAAERLLARLEQGGAGGDAIATLLGHLDNRLPLLRDLLVVMLARRDQWLRHIDPRQPGSAERAGLEAAMAARIELALDEAHRALGAELLGELWDLGVQAAGQLAGEGGESRIAALEGPGPPEPQCSELQRWLALAELVLTRDGGVRRSVDARLGFPAAKDPLLQERKRRMLAACAAVAGEPRVAARLQALRRLPEPLYGEGQWQVLAALVTLLPLADAALREVFRSRGQIDFSGIARGALDALGDDLAPQELLLHLDSRLRHILVDEFQDTARGQFELLERLTSGWEPGDGRTLFVVGDPMQSIYRFREAEVGLYLRTRRLGLGDLHLEALTLTANFRSDRGLVEWCNASFVQLFPAEADELHGAVPFAAADPVRGEPGIEAVTLTCYSGRCDLQEAQRVVELVKTAQAEDPEATVGILVRSRTHLAAIVPALKSAGLTWQAQEIDPLAGRPVIRDLHALTRALLHPAERIAWLALLRAPWCGLTLTDLLALCADQAETPLWAVLSGEVRQPGLFTALSDDGQRRLERILPALASALAGKGRIPLRRLVESTWLRLCGPAGLSAAELADAGQYFALLAELDDGGDLPSLELLQERLARLFAAPDPAASAKLQLMTIHKAKGLEFDTVILPGLGRGVRPAERSLLLWQELPPDPRCPHELLLAPLPASTSSEPDPTYRAIASIHAEQERCETLRLFYVAATRARHRLHLLGHARLKEDGELLPAAGSLLQAAWPALGGAALGNCLAPVGEGPVQGAEVLLQRLPLDWQAPAPEAALPLALALPRLASRPAGGEPGWGISLSLKREEGRLVGTLVHGWLDRIAREGLTNWPVERIEGLLPVFSAALAAAGIPAARLAECSSRVAEALSGALRGERGRWVLGGHAEAACELPLSGVIDGEVVHAVIDRTFVDDRGARWVIDYKTSQPGDGESREEFMVAEAARYAAQLATYRTLLERRHGGGGVRAALYFPLLDAWREVVEGEAG